MLQAQVPRTRIGPAEIRRNRSDRARFVVRSGVQRRIAANDAGVRKDRSGYAPIDSRGELNTRRSNIAWSRRPVQQRSGWNGVHAKRGDSLLRYKDVEAFDHLNDAAGSTHNPL